MNEQMIFTMLQMLGVKTDKFNSMRKVLALLNNISRKGAEFLDLIALIRMFRPDLKPLLDLIKNFYDLKKCSCTF